MEVQYRLVQFVPDLDRNEPVNVGVITDDGTETDARFWGEGAPAVVVEKLPRWLPLDRADYEGWIRYFRGRLADGQLYDGLTRLRQSSIRVSPAPSFADIAASGIHQATGELFERLVDRPSRRRASKADRIGAAVDRILVQAVGAFEENVSVPAEYDGKRTSVPFRRRARQGLMDFLVGQRPDDIGYHARELESRISAAQRVQPARVFIAFVEMDMTGAPGYEEAIIPLERLGEVVAVDNESQAVDDVQALLSPAPNG